jgi:hypothetical protein
MEMQLVYRSCYQGNLVCHIAPSLRLLVPSGLQVRRPSADANRHRFAGSNIEEPK